MSAPISETERRQQWSTRLAPATIEGINRMTREVPGVRSQGAAVDMLVADYWAKRDRQSKDAK